MNFINVKSNPDVYADGIHNDSKALQTCIDSVKDGGTIYFPDGIYLISTTLIFYSNQHFVFSDKAVILRDEKAEPITRYLLAAYSEPDWKGYEGTHNVTITGGIFDGNKNTDERATLLNTVHCENIVIENARFLHGAAWHFIEINSTKNATVRNCVFDGPTYTFMHEALYNEQIQLDLAQQGSYGPVYNCDGTLIDFCKDDTVCCDIVIENNIFKCEGFPAIGHHNSCSHHNITIRNNIFDGPSGKTGVSRGYILFRPDVYDVKVENNTFLAPEKEYDSPNVGIVMENPNAAALKEIDNLYKGYFTEKVVIGKNSHYK